MFIQIIQEYMYLPDMLVERFLFIIFSPNVTLKCDSGKKNYLILFLYSKLNSCLDSTSLENTFSQKATYLTYGHHCCGDRMLHKCKWSLFPPNLPEVRRFSTLLKRWGRWREGKQSALLAFLSYLRGS